MLRFHAFAFAIVTFGIWGCGEEDDSTEEYTYGTSQVRTAIEGTWAGSTDDDASGTSTATLTLSYVPTDVRSQCGNRMLAMGGARSNLSPRCMDTSEMLVGGTFEAPTTRGPEDVNGSFMVGSLNFEGNGSLDMSLGGDRRLSGVLRDEVLAVDIRNDGGVVARYSLKRAR